MFCILHTTSFGLSGAEIFFFKSPVSLAVSEGVLVLFSSKEMFKVELTRQP